MVLSPVAQDHVARPRHLGKPEQFTHVGYGGVPGDGPYVTMYLDVQAGTILSCGFECNGCPSSIAAGSAAATLIHSREFAKAQTLNGADILAFLGGLPEGKGYYADLAAEAIATATPILEN